MAEPMAATAGVPAGLISSVRLGTTVATNALLEHQQALLLLLTNAGQLDQLRIGDQHRSDLFALDPPSVRFGSAGAGGGGRLDASGAEVEPLQLDSNLRQSLSDQQRRGIDVAVVALLHAHRNPVHEQACAELLRQLGFGTVICSTVSAKPRLVPRGQTALAEGAVAPVLQAYLQQVQGALGAATPLRVMTSSGRFRRRDVAGEGHDSLRTGRRNGGAVAAARAAGYVDVPVLGFDMGGITDVFCVASADDAVLQDPQSQTEIAGLTLLAERLPIETVAAAAARCWSGMGRNCGWDLARRGLDPARPVIAPAVPHDHRRQPAAGSAAAGSVPRRVR